MTELKTLKDFESLIVYSKGYSELCKGENLIKVLKAEAVKWVKPEVGTELTKEQNKAYKNVVNFIMHFFNLTEEDLK